MSDNDLTRRILDAVDAGFDEQLAFTQELVRFPSLRGQEHTCQDFLFEAMRRRGFAMDRWRIDEAEIKDHPGFSPIAVSYENAWNVVGTYRPEKQDGRSLILNGHVDVVPTGPRAMWSRDPFDPMISDGWMYGRGSADMKAGLAANLFAYDALLRCGVKPAAPIYFQSVVEEECTGNGALSCWVRGYRADAAIIPEPEENMLVRANVGVLWFEVRVQGRPAHTREMSTGLNAIKAAYKLIAALEELEIQWNARQGEHRHFEHLDHPININIGTIEGGDWTSTVPPWCNFTVRAAMYPGTTADEARREIEDCIRQAALRDPQLSNNPPEVVFNGFYAEGYVLEEGSDAEEALKRAHRAVFAEDLKSFVTPGYLDARVFMLYGGIPTLVYGPVSESIHGFDERVEIESVRRITKTIALFIADWCGVTAA